MKKLLLAASVCVTPPTLALAHYRHLSPQRIHYDAGHVISHPSGCPWYAFCGCGVSVRVFGHPVRDLFLAANWFRFPRVPAAPGMVAVRNHHVFFIERVVGNGMVEAYDPNSGGHLTRDHVVSLRGMTVVDPHGSAVASVMSRHHGEHHVRYAAYRHRYRHYARNYGYYSRYSYAPTRYYASWRY